MAPVAPYRRLFGKPDGTLVRLRCFVLGHAWWPCDPGCCDRWWCERCAMPGPLLDGFAPRKRRYRTPGSTPEAASPDGEKAS